MSAESGVAIGPAAEEIRRQLLDQISRGQLHPGERLGAERDLAQGLGVSRSTVRQALAALEEAGVVRRVPGRGGGTFVRRQKIERDLFTPVRCHGKAAAVYRNAIAGVNATGNPRSGQLQLRSAISRTNPEHASSFLN